MFLPKQWIAKAKTIKLENDRLILKPTRFYTDTYNRQRIQNYSYQMIRKKDNRMIGFCDLRDGDKIALYYLGHIGYNIFPQYQGEGLAVDATLLLIKLAKEIGMDELLITCNTDNVASIKTIERSGFKYIDSVSVPVDEPLYHQGDYFKHIYTMDLKE